MLITQIRLSNFKSFGPEPTAVVLSDLTFILGPNGAGKTTALEALSRMFSPLVAQRKIQLEDFHIPRGMEPIEVHSEGPTLWLEVDIEFPEAAHDEQRASVPPFFAHMSIANAEAVPRVRVRLTATVTPDFAIEEAIEYVLDTDIEDEPTMRSTMSRLDRASIEVHYLPARRDPADHISFATTSLIGRMLRAVDWTSERESLKTMSEQLSDTLAVTPAVQKIGEQLTKEWTTLHMGNFFSVPSMMFGSGDLESILRQLTVTFSPSHDGNPLPFERLSDGQKSLLYISLVLAWQSISRGVLNGEVTAFDTHRLRPAVHTVLALEEPENSLAPYYLGRITKQLNAAADRGDVQSLIATHAPGLLRRVAPDTIRYLRLNSERETKVHSIVLPPSKSDSAKYVREAVEAFPELYFSRLVVLGEGDSEQIVLPRVLAAAGIAEDEASVCVVPLGGRHVNHFWRLLKTLEIPHVTLLDLDYGRHAAGWGRVRYALNQYNELIGETFEKAAIKALPAWNDVADVPLFDDPNYQSGAPGPVAGLERRGVFFSTPVDLDLMMMKAYPSAYGVTPTPNPDAKLIASVLGQSNVNASFFKREELELFADYHQKFGIGSKPAVHLEALSSLSNDELISGLPEVLKRLVAAVKERLEELEE